MINLLVQAPAWGRNHEPVQRSDHATRPQECDGPLRRRGANPAPASSPRSPGARERLREGDPDPPDRGSEPALLLRGHGWKPIHNGAGESTAAHPREVIEAALVHRLK